jgi:hypothetical protein
MLICDFLQPYRIPRLFLFYRLLLLLHPLLLLTPPLLQELDEYHLKPIRPFSYPPSSQK